jgi:hypothetical protein
MVRFTANQLLRISVALSARDVERGRRRSNLMCDYIVDKSGKGTHLTLQAALEDALEDGGKRTIHCDPNQVHVIGDPLIIEKPAYITVKGKD